MNENQKAFIQRHVRESIAKEVAPDKALKQSLHILKDSSLSSEVENHYARSGSLIETFAKFNIVEIDETIVTGLKQAESSNSDCVSLNRLLETNQTLNDIYALLKVKSSIGLAYALWLSIFATSVFALVNLKILPQFEMIFSDFGSELPSFTKAAIAWQNSLISPTVIGLLFIAVVGLLLFSINTISMKSMLEDQTGFSRLIAHLPFVKSVINYTRSVRWMSHFGVLTAAGLSSQKSFEQLSDESKTLERLLPNAKENMQSAEAIGNLGEEIEYQSRQLEFQAEGLVTNAVRKLTATVMVFVVAFVVFTIFASYLPIFQLGAVV